MSNMSDPEDLAINSLIAQYGYPSDPKLQRLMLRMAFLAGYSTGIEKGDEIMTQTMDKVFGSEKSP
jgi:hypothetical protein